jgi:hypothetical protein
MDTTSEPITSRLFAQLGRDGAKLAQSDSGPRLDPRRHRPLCQGAGLFLGRLRLRFRLSAMFQTITGEIDVLRGFREGRGIGLPLTVLQSRVCENNIGRGSIESGQRRLLEGPKPRMLPSFRWPRPLQIV